jgi:hypothetical protein
MTSQTEELLKELEPLIERVRNDLASGARPSEIANWLHEKGLGTIKVMFIFVNATGVSLGKVKAMGLWWGPEGVTNVQAFDQEARRLLSERRAN